MRCLSFFGHPCLCLQIPSFQGLDGIFTRWILAMPGTLRYRLSALFGVRVLRLAHQQQASCLLLPGRLRSLPPPSMAAFLRYRLSALFGVRVLRLAHQQQASCLLLPGRLRSLSPLCIGKRSSRIASKS